MNQKGFFSALLCLISAMALTSRAQSYGVRDDLWDISKGTVITFTTGVLGSTTDPGMFGGDDGGSITTHFSDNKGSGFVHAVEWRTTNTVRVNRVKLYATGDGAAFNNQREFARFTLKIKSPGSTTFDTTVLTFVPTHPYTFIGDKFVLDQTFPTVSAREFRGEFQQIDFGNLNGPRVIELDAFGPPPSDPPVIVSSPVPTSVFLGETAKFTVGIGGTEPFAFQWRHEETNVVDSSRISGTTGTQLIIQNVSLDDGGNYSVAVSNLFGNVLTTNVLLNVVLDTNAPSVAISQPVLARPFDRTVGLHGTVSDNNRVVSVRLERNGEVFGTLAFAGGAFSTNVSLALGENVFKVIALDPAGNAGSAEVTVNAPADTNAPAITLTAPALVTPFDKTVVLQGTVSDDDSVATFRWERNGEAMGNLGVIGGAFASSVPLVAGENRLKILATDPTGNVASVEATVTVTADTIAPIVTISQPVAGGSVSKSATLAGTAIDNHSIASIRWERNGVDMGAIAVGNGFSFGIQLVAGENRIKVIATDVWGNVGSSEVIVVWETLAESSTDLWDISEGTVVTSSSGFLFSQATVGMFGGAGLSSEPGTTIFSDGRTNGFVHSIEWKTLTPVAINNIRLFATGDSGQSFRSFARFTLKAKSPGSTNFDLTILNFEPTQPIPFLSTDAYLVLNTNVTVFTGQEFRAEFVQLAGGPRILELDAFGPVSTSAPEITVQPNDATAFVGGSRQFSIGATGARPLTYEWKHEGTNLTESARFVGVNSWGLTVKNLTEADAGNYSVVVRNQLGETTSSNAFMTVTVDTNAPVITIVSPAAGTTSTPNYILGGTITDNEGVASARWERNGISAGSLSLIAGQFILPNQNLFAGENRIRVIAADRSGNQSTNEIVVTWMPPRAIQLITPAPQQEGARITVPISLVSTGGVSGATFAVGFDTNFLADPQFEWVDAGDLGLTISNLESNKIYRASFAAAGSTVPSGARTIANMSFRTRSVRTNTTINFSVTLVGMYSETGDPFTAGNYIQGTTALITKRKIIADNNANDRLDVADATVILRLVAGAETPRSWDAAANDLNSTLTLDSGDAIKVLRAVVGIDPQPTVPALAFDRSFTSSIKASGPAANAPVRLVADKATASAGEKVTLEVRLADQTKSLTGMSFRMEYPPDALKLENGTSQQIGAIVPLGALTAWNVAPSQNNYVTQNGAVSLAVSTANVWPSSNGVVARLTFTVQAGATSRYGWPVQLKNVEVARSDFQVESMAASGWTFVARAPGDAQFSGSVTFSGQTPRLTLQGDLGATYVIEGSSDLKTWDVVGVYLNSTGSVTVEDSAATGASARFYRATLQQ